MTSSDFCGEIESPLLRRYSLIWLTDFSIDFRLCSREEDLQNMATSSAY